MSISIYLHKIYQQYCNGEEIIHVEGNTVNECLNHMAEIYPEIGRVIFTGQNKLHPLVEIYLNSSSTYPDALKKKVKDGDKLHLIHTLAGG
ncbi:MAG: MoaD/ThiS family protein [Desulfobacteraceae bacterium]